MNLNELNKETEKKKQKEHEKAMKKLDKSSEKEKKPKYKSKDGFVHIPVLRGFTEISKLYYLTRGYGTTILGGYVRYMCSPLTKVPPAGDIDIYLPNRGSFDEIVKKFEDNSFEVKSENVLAITYKPFDKSHPMFPCPKVQLVKPMEEGVVVTQGDMEVVLENFDFTVVRIGLLNPNEALADADFLHDEEKKFLRIKNIHCPISTTYRIMKYNRKGYWPSTRQIIKVFLDWDDRDPEYKRKIIEFLQKENPTEEEIDQMEKMLRVFD